ncbi:MAG: hypothetical protein R3332_13975 [Pseudohongiellaceae bacterium]|nr:hypothetical protein [Pseudohongiellaceae bacterium]
MKKTPKPSSDPSPEVTTLKSSTCPTLSHRSTLTYELGLDPEKTFHFRIISNDGGGFFSPEWVSWASIAEAISKAQPVTSRSLRPIFKGKSVNTAGFFLAILIAEGLLVNLPKKTRQFTATDKTPTGTTSKATKASNKKS